MNLIPAIGPFDFKVYGSQKAFLNRPTEFVIRNENSQIQEILIINPKRELTSCDIFGKQIDGNLSLEFQPEEIGLHEIRIFSNKTNRTLYNSFEFNVYDSSKLNINCYEEAVVGKLFKFSVECKKVGEGTINVQIEQQERKLRPIVKQIKNDNNNSYIYEICFTPEIESKCIIEVEFMDNSESILTGNSLKIDVKAKDFIIIPFPLQPFSINTKCSFNIDLLHDNIKNFKLVMKPSNQESLEKIEYEVNHIEKNLYQISFTPKSIERHFCEIYFGNELINPDRAIKIDIFDVSKIKAKMPNTIMFGELNTFVVDTTGAGEGNLEVIIKDGYDTLNAQLLKREKRKFEIGFFCERNMKHDIQVIFNGIQIKDSPFYVLPELLVSKSMEVLNEIGPEDYMVIEGGPLDGLQCGEKMWIIFDAQSTPYYDAQFLVVDDNNYPIKHTKIQQEDGRWRIEFIPINVGVHQIQRIIQDENRAKIQLLHKVNVLHYSAQRIVYGYKLNNIEDSVQLVFDAANYRVQDIGTNVKDPNDEIVKEVECKYLSDYLALKFTPSMPGGYLVNFFDRKSAQQIASSPYKIIVHEDFREIIRSSGIYDLTRLSIAATNLPANYDLKSFKIDVYDSQDKQIQNCFYSNKKKDLIVEFISRIEGVHKIYLYINKQLVDDNPFLIYVNGDTYSTNSLSGIFSANPMKSSSGINGSGRWNSSSSNDFGGSFSGQSIGSNSDSQIMPYNTCQAAIGHGTILYSKTNMEFHFVINDKNIQSLCVNDPLNDPVPFKLGEDDHGNGSIIILPKLEGTHKIIGLIEGRDFEAQLFVLDQPGYETLFEMDNYALQNSIEKPFNVKLKENNLEVDVYDPLGERVDVRYTGENLATFIPRTTGYFKIYISDYHGPILGSPFFALVHQSSDLNESASVESSGIRDTIRNEETKFIIRNKDLELDVQIKDPNGEPIVLRKKRTQQGYLQVFYTPEIIGPHEINIFKDGIKTIGSPIIIHVSDPNLVKVDNLLRESKVNQPFAFNIDASKAGEGFIRVNIKDSKMDDILPEITEIDDRNYIVRFIPKLTGLYEFSLTFNKYHVIESPFKIVISDDETSRNIDKQKSYKNIPGNKEDANSELKEEESTSPNYAQKQFTDIPSSIDYELNTWNNQLNNSLNKIMEATGNQTMKRALTPITDTSEEESNENTLPIYRGETYIENVERLPDGSSHLLLRIEDDNELIDSKNPHNTRGKYKYRFKRIGHFGEWSQTQGIKIDPINENRNDENSNTEGESDMSEKSKEIVQSALHTAIETIQDGSSKSDKTQEAEETASKADDSAKYNDDLSQPSVTEKRKLFESSKKQKQSQPAEENQKSTDNIPKGNKVLDLVKQLNQSSGSAKPSHSTENTSNSKSKKEKKKEKQQDQAEVDMLPNENVTQVESENDDEEINVTNENIVTRLTKANQKKINQEKTVVIEEKYVIKPRTSELNSENSSNKKDDDTDDHSISSQDSNLVGKDEKTKTVIDNVTKITTEKSGKNKRKETEEMVKREHIEPRVVRAGSNKELGDDKSTEKFKPEESIQYEYEQVIEQPDAHLSGEANKGGKKVNKNKTKIENTTKQTTKQETKEKFEKTENPTPDQVKTITTDMTTFITEEVEHQLTETIEKTTDTQEFTYQQLKNKQNSDTAGYLKPANLVNLAEQLNSNIVDDSSESDFVTATISVTTSREYEYQHGPLVSDRAKLQRSGSNENIIDYYKLQPVSAQNTEVDDLRSMLQPVDLNNLQHGEQFKTQECTTFDDSISKSLSKSTRKLSGPLNRDYDDDEDSLVEIEESLIYEEIRPINNQNVAPKSSSPSQASYFKPIETMTAEDFFSVPRESTEQPTSTLKPIDLIKARFEGSEADVGRKPAAKAASNEENTILAQIGKLPRSKVQLYDQDLKQDEETEPKKKHITQFKPSASSESEFKPGKNRIVTKIPRDSSLGDPLEDSDDVDRSNTEKSEENSIKKRSKIRKPQIYPIDDNPIDDDFKSGGSNRTESSHKSSSEEESIFKRPEKTLNQEKEDSQEANAGASEKSIKSLLNKYEKKPPSKSEPNTESSNSAGKESKDQSDQTAESKRVKKLPKNIVDMFNSGKKDLEPTSSKYASAKNENEANRPFKASTLVSDLSAKNKDVDYTDNVFEDENKKPNQVDDEIKEKENNTERVKKLSKSIISQYEKRESPEEKSSERKSILDIKSERSDSQSSDEPKKLPKSTFHKYESSPSDSLDSRKKFFEEKQQRKSSSSSTDSDKIYSRPRSLSKPPNYESKPSTQGKFNSQAKYEERSSEDDQNDKGVRKLVDKYEKKPDKTTRDEIVDDVAKYPRAKSLTEEHRLHEQTKAPIIKNLISSLIDEKKNESNSSSNSSPANSQPNHDEKGIKKLINKYQPEASSLLSSSTSNELSPKEIVARKPEPTKNIKNILSKNSSPSSEEKSLELKTQKPDEIKTNETRNNISNETIELATTKPNENEQQPAAQQKEKGVKNLVNRYENKPYAVETSEKPNTAATPQDISKPSNDLTSTGRLGKHLLESYEKPTNTAEIQKPKTDIIDYLENKAPISVYYTLNEPAPAQTPLIDSIPSFMKLSNEPKLEKMPLYDTNDVKKSKNIKKIIQQYEKSPAEQLKHDLIEDEPTVEEKVQEYVRKLPKSLFNRYEKVEPVEQSQLLEENGDRLKGYDEELPSLTYEEKISLSMPNKYIPNTHVFRSAHSDLTAILHIPKPEDASRIKIENDPKMKVNLKIDNNEPVNVEITSVNNQKLPFRAKSRRNQNVFTFIHDKVEDFNIAMGKSDFDTDFSSNKKIKSLLEITSSKNYEFKLVDKLTNEAVPFKSEKKEPFKQKFSYEQEPNTAYTVKLLPNENEPSYYSENRTTDSAYESNDKNESSPKRTSRKRSDSLGLKKSNSNQLSSLENILERTKSEINKKLKDLKAAAIKVQLEVEYKNPLAFVVTKASNGQPIEFQPIDKPNDRHVIYFNYDSTVDFSIGIREDPANQVLNKDDSSDSSEQVLNAEIEISVAGEYDFQIIRKDTQQPIDIYVLPKRNNAYKILFKALSITNYTLKAVKRPSTGLEQSLTDEELAKQCCDQTVVKSKLKQNFINPIIDQIPSDLISSYSIPNSDSNIKINVSITDPNVESSKSAHKSKDTHREVFSPIEAKNPTLNCTVYNPKNLEINELLKTSNSVSFIVNTKDAGDGELKCYANYSDGNENALVEQYQLDKNIYSIRIYAKTIKQGMLSLYLEHDNETRK